MQAVESLLPQVKKNKYKQFGLMAWYLVQTKVHQEERAFENIARQGFDCLFPIVRSEVVRKGRVCLKDEPLFSRYIFVKVDGNESWAPLRNTRGIQSLVKFGENFARVPDDVIDEMKKRQFDEKSSNTFRPLFKAHDKVFINSGPFKNFNAIFDAGDGESRAMVLIEFLSNTVRWQVPIKHLKKIET